MNWRTTGSPTRFGYEVLWGSGVNLGFHQAVPWGEAHTPLRGLELLYGAPEYGANRDLHSGNWGGVAPNPS